MAPLNVGTITVDCPVCRTPISLDITTRRVVGKRVGPNQPFATLAVDVDFERDGVPSGHEDCFTVTADERAVIESFDGDA